MLRRSAASPDEQRIAVASEDGRVTIWHRRQQRGGTDFKHGNTIMGAAYNPLLPGRLVSASFVGETCAALWTAVSEGWSRRDLGPRTPHRGVAMSPRGDLFAICGDYPDIPVFDADGSPVRVFQSDGAFGEDDEGPEDRPGRSRRERSGFVLNVSISHDSRRVAWVAPTGRIQVGDLETGQVSVVEGDREERFWSVIFSPVEAAFVAVTTAGTAVWVDAAGARRPLLENASERSTFGRGVPVAFSRDGKRLAVATSGSGITIVSTEDPSRQVQLQGHTETFKRGWQEAVGAPAFSPEGSFLVSAGSRQSGGKDPRTVRLWDPITGEQLLRIIVDGDCLAASVDPFSETICVGCEHRLLLVPVERWLLSGDTTAIKQSTERLLGARAEDLL